MLIKEQADQTLSIDHRCEWECEWLFVSIRGPAMDWRAGIGSSVPLVDNRWMITRSNVC